MILISRIRIELNQEAVIPCNIETEESLDSFRNSIIEDLKRYNIKADVEFTYKELPEKKEI